MRQHQLLKLAPKKFVAPTISDQQFTWHDCLTAKTQADGSLGWRGLLTNHHPLTTPILYHKGSWRVSQGMDPEAGGSPLWGPIRTSHEYGGVLGSQGGVTRVPNAILYDTNLEDFASVDIEATIDSQAALLNTKGVFAGGLEDIFSSWLVGPFPPTDSRIIQATDRFFRQVDVSADDWTGGNLLYLLMIPLTAYNVERGSPLHPLHPDPFLWYYSTANAYTLPAITTADASSPDPPPTTTLVLNSTQLAYDAAQLALCSPNFNRLRMIVYVQSDNPSFPPTVPGESAILLGFNSSLAQYGVVVKGPYPVTQNITSVIQADIQEFFG